MLLLAGILILTFLTPGCEKFLAEKPDQKLAAPSTIEDAQALLDNYITMNTQTPNIGAMSDDDFYFLDAYYNSLDIIDRNIYTWERDVYPDNGWKTMYKVVLHANMALETIKNIQRSVYNQTIYDNVYGSALFFRSFAFHYLLQVYSTPYHAATAANEPGIALRLSSDIATPTLRSSVASCYEQVIRDTKAAIPYLPAAALLVSRPSKAAAYSLLSDVYLTMQNYTQAGLYADSALQLHNTLLNYNTFDTTQLRPFTRFNEEVIFSASTAGSSNLATATQKVDTVLYGQYHYADLRRPLFFRKFATNQYGFKGNYQNSSGGILFSGYAVDEMMLIRAECAARNNDIVTAMADVNALLLKRYKPGTLVPYTAATAADALAIVLKERRKELVGRGKRWNDLRRLNQDPQKAITIRRLIDGNIFSLPPNSKRYRFYLPEQVVQLSGIAQNER